MPAAAMPIASEAMTVDAFLGGRIEAVQPSRGHHRSGLDAVLLAAGLDESTAGRVIDLGSGVGIAGFCVAARTSAEVVLAEREIPLIEWAGLALQRPANAAFAGRVRLACVDLLADEPRRAAGLLPSTFDHAIMNPPFHDGGSVRSSPNGERARAHVLADGGLDDWFRAAAALVRPGGSLTVILPAGRLADLLAACEGRFGSLSILPVHARPAEAAIRVLARGIKGSRGPLRLLPGLNLHGEAGGAFTPGVDALLRDGDSLRNIHPAWGGVEVLPRTPARIHSQQFEGSLP